MQRYGGRGLDGFALLLYQFNHAVREFGITLLITLSVKEKVITRNIVSLQLKIKILKKKRDL